ncbi:hypothetical protein J5J86_10935 [Aquabacter sp. L1I39]|uniref:hypothetical protein n=1 Tax=Aquabacter sp. L1I39 TaxID=2820278 RepID=UPI001ADABD90|nr:hypothetical protein [Aquabacter sp. L1I39]QTL05755.1 hypothetical protein J5J86_10935 [Aquabacter sp. L1I39]
MIRLGTGLMSAAYWRPRAGLLPATTALVARMTAAPPAGRVVAIDALVRALVAAGVWSRLDLLHVLAAHDTQAARLNWISSAYDLAAYNSPLFTAHRGFKGDGTAAYLEAAGYNPSAATLRFAQNSMTLGAWMLTPSSAAVGLDVYGGNSRVQRRTSGSNDLHYRANDGTSTFWPSGGALDGLMVADRADAATKALYRNGALTHSAAVASTGNSTILRLFAAGAGSAMSDAEIAVVFAGASLTEAQHAALHAALRTYLLKVGAIAP